jgi:folate-binding protein YgfZ
VTTSLPSVLLRLTGKDALPLLHRISSQALEDLAHGDARATLFCDFRARLLFRAHVARLADDSVWLLHELAPGPALAQHLDKHIFREDVKLEDWSDRFAVRGRVESGLTQALPLLEEGGRPTRLVVGQNAALDVVPIDTALPLDQLYAWEVARIATGRPRHGHEIAEAFHPFEVGLADEVHLSKGCYTGQEVLQRLITYRSVRRQLARIAGAGAPPATPVPLCIGDERVGTVTSAIAAGPGWAGLAVLSAKALEPAAEVRVEDGGVLSEIAPFELRRPRGRDARVA